MLNTEILCFADICFNKIIRYDNRNNHNCTAVAGF